MEKRLKSVYSYGLEKTQRNLTYPDILENKAKGLKMTQATASNAEEAAAVQAAGIDMLGLTADNIVDAARRAAPNIYLIAPVNAEVAVHPDEVLREAFRNTMAGADQIYTMRGPHIVEMLAREDISVHGHVGLVPRKSVRSGGLRAYGKTAEEAMQILQDIKSLEDAGAVAVEVECVADEAMELINRHTRLITHGIGSGSKADVIFMFTQDICGEESDPPKHAHAFSNLQPIKQALSKERLRGLNAFKAAVDQANFPNEAVNIRMLPGEAEKLAESLDKLPG